VYVSAIDTPGHFWVQNVTKDSKLLDNLVEQMTQFYGDRGLGHNLIPPKVGDLCCATFQHDESWYRGEIVQVMEDKSEVRIHYLDFGDTGVVSMANVKEIRSGQQLYFILIFLVLPPICTLCTIPTYIYVTPPITMKDWYIR
jgi:tudor domain-containing protein 2